jgi:hypothetical protein
MQWSGFGGVAYMAVIEITISFVNWKYDTIE